MWVVLTRHILSLLRPIIQGKPCLESIKHYPVVENSTDLSKFFQYTYTNMCFFYFTYNFFLNILLFLYMCNLLKYLFLIRYILKHLLGVSEFKFKLFMTSCFTWRYLGILWLYPISSFLINSKGILMGVCLKQQWGKDKAHFNIGWLVYLS